MRIYKCIFTGDEVLCDNDRPLAEVDDAMYVVEGKYIEIGGEDYGISANVDEEAAEGATGDGTNDQKVRVVDVVHQNRLSETQFDKKSYLAYLKDYLKRVNEQLKETCPERSAPFMAAAQTFIKKMVPEFDDYQFFMGASNSTDGIIVLAKWEGEKAMFFFWKDGMKGEKV